MLGFDIILLFNDVMVVENSQNKIPLTGVSGFKSKVYVQQMESGPSPDTASFIQRVEEEKLAKQRGDTKDNRSFFAK